MRVERSTQEGHRAIRCASLNGYSAPFPRPPPEPTSVGAQVDVKNTWPVTTTHTASRPPTGPSASCVSLCGCFGLVDGGSGNRR